MIYKYGNFYFDDINQSEGSSKWSQVCQKHFEEISKDKRTPAPGFQDTDPRETTCGVYECQENAIYYIDFINEPESSLIDEKQVLLFFHKKNLNPVILFACRYCCGEFHCSLDTDSYISPYSFDKMRHHLLYRHSISTLQATFHEAELESKRKELEERLKGINSMTLNELFDFIKEYEQLVKTYDILANRAKIVLNVARHYSKGKDSV